LRYLNQLIDFFEDIFLARVGAEHVVEVKLVPLDLSGSSRSGRTFCNSNRNFRKRKILLQPYKLQGLNVKINQD
jgi:hypothetical protein